MEKNNIEGLIPFAELLKLMQDPKYKVVLPENEENISKIQQAKDLKIQYQLMLQNMEMQIALGEPDEVYGILVELNVSNEIWAYALKVHTMDKVYFTPQQIVDICNEKQDKQICEFVLDSGKLEGEMLEKVKNILEGLK